MYVSSLKQWGALPLAHDCFFLLSLRFTCDGTRLAVDAFLLCAFLTSTLLSPLYKSSLWRKWNYSRRPIQIVYSENSVFCYKLVCGHCNQLNVFCSCIFAEDGKTWIIFIAIAIPCWTFRIMHECVHVHYAIRNSNCICSFFAEYWSFFLCVFLQLTIHGVVMLI